MELEGHLYTLLGKNQEAAENQSRPNPPQSEEVETRAQEYKQKVIQLFQILECTGNP